MKFLKTWIRACYLLLFVAGPILAQSPFLETESTGPENYFNKVQEVERYYQNRDKGRGSGYKQFKRWEHWQRRHLHPKGNIGSIGHANWNAFYLYQKQKALKNDQQGDEIPAANWQSKGLTQYRLLSTGFNGGLGRVNCLAFNPQNKQEIYAGTPAGGLWFSPDEGASWQSLTDGLPNIGISGISLDEQTSPGQKILYLLSGDGDGRNTPSLGVFKSTDGGNSWMRTGLQWTADELVYGYKLSSHPQNPQVLYVVSTVGVFRSQDGALSWERILPVYCTDLEFHPSNPSIVYAAAYGQVFRSDNGGDTWSLLGGGLPSGLNCRVAIAVSPHRPDFVYVLYGQSTANGQYEGLYRSEDTGLNFSLRSNAPNILGYSTFGSGMTHQAWYDLALLINPDNADEVHTGAINCWKSPDGGLTWQNTSNWFQPSATQNNYTHADIHNFLYAQGKIYCASDGGVYAADINTLQWQDLSQGLDITQVYGLGLMADSSERIFLGTQDNGLNYVSQGEMYHWYGSDGFDTYHASQTQLLYGMVPQGAIQVLDEKNVVVYPFKPANFEQAAWETPYQVREQSSTQDLIYVGYKDFWQGSLELVSGRPSLSWTNLSKGSLDDRPSDRFAIAPSDPQRIYLSKFNQLYRSLDGGAKWLEITSNLPHTSFNLIQAIMVHPQDPEKVWICYGGYFEDEKVFYSADGGNTWTNQSQGLPNLPANTICIDTQQEDGLYLGMDVGVYYKNERMEDWVLYAEGLPNTIINELDIDKARGKLLAGTFGRGVWESDLIQESCPLNLVLANTLIGEQDISAQESIETSAQVDSAARILLDAGQEISLKPGFFATSYGGGSFEAKIGGCDALLDLRSPQTGLSGAYIGEMPGLLRSLSPSEAFSEEPGFWIYPNPTREIAHLEFNLKQECPKLQIVIYKESGERVHTWKEAQTLPAGNHALSIPVAHWSAGTYIFQLNTGKDVIHKKVMVLR